MNSINSIGSFHLANNSSVQLENTLGTSSVTRKGDMEKLKAACDNFEAIFIKQMLDSMKKTINRSDLNKPNMGEEIFDDMLYDEYAKKMSGTAGLGIGDMMFQQLSRQLPSDILG